uniref:Secreted protein n=1 Tax=Candidozyma auris TaxID=498019 RepID=A0A0L0NTV2_CANAR
MHFLASFYLRRFQSFPSLWVWLLLGGLASAVDEGRNVGSESAITGRESPEDSADAVCGCGVTRLRRFVLPGVATLLDLKCEIMLEMEKSDPLESDGVLLPICGKNFGVLRFTKGTGETTPSRSSHSQPREPLSGLVGTTVFFNAVGW